MVKTIALLPAPLEVNSNIILVTVGGVDLTVLNAAVSTLGAQSAAADTGQAARIDVLEATDLTHSGRMDGLDTDVTTLTAADTAQSALITANAAEITVVKSDVEIHTSLIRNIESDVTSLQNTDTSQGVRLDTLDAFAATKGQPNGLCPLTAGGVIANSLIPPLALTKPTVYASLAVRDADSSVQ